MLPYVAPLLFLILSILLMSFYSRITFVLMLWYFALIILTLLWYDILRKSLLTVPLAFVICCIYFLGIAISISANYVNPNYFVNIVFVLLLCVAVISLVLLSSRKVSALTAVFVTTFIVTLIGYIASV